MGMGRSGNSQMGIPLEWETVTKMGLGIGRNGEMINGNRWEWERVKPLLLICSCIVCQLAYNPCAKYLGACGRHGVCKPVRGTDIVTCSCLPGFAEPDCLGKLF